MGLGVGAAYVAADASVLGAKLVDDNDTVLAYQGVAGVEYRVSDAVAIGARYVYFAAEDPTFTDSLDFDFESEVESHSLMATLRISR